METKAPNTPKAAEAKTPTSEFFKNPEVNAKYLAPMGADSVIHIPGKYSGHLSGISLEVAAVIKINLAIKNF